MPKPVVDIRLYVKDYKDLSGFLTENETSIAVGINGMQKLRGLFRFVFEEEPVIKPLHGNGNKFYSAFKSKSKGYPGDLITRTFHFMFPLIMEYSKTWMSRDRIGGAIRTGEIEAWIETAKAKKFPTEEKKC